MIRLLTPTDAAAFWRLRLEALETEPRAFGAFGASAAEHREINVDETAERLKSAAEGSFVVGAFDDGQLVAQWVLRATRG